MLNAMLTTMEMPPKNASSMGLADAAPTSASLKVQTVSQENIQQPNSPADHQDCQEQVLALLEALDLLSMIAAESSSTTATDRLDELQKKWKLEDTSVPRLLNSIQRLHSTSHLLQQDADGHAEQVQSLQYDLDASQVRIHLLEKAVTKLHKKNERLTRKLEQKNKERKSIAKQVKEYVQQVKKQDHDAEQRVAHQLFAHERLLKLDNSVRGGNRSRCSSRDTQFSDFDMAALSPFDDFDELSIVSSCSSSVSTATSLVTDEGVATVRYAPALVGDDRSMHKKVHDFDLTFPQGCKIGLQFHKVMLEKSKRGLLNDAIQDKEQAPPVDNHVVSASKESGFSMHFNFDALRGKHHDEDYVYLVCGHYGFDRDLNELPPLGSRLVKVGGESVDKWTLDMIRESLKCTEREFFTLTFRNEPLNQKQNEILLCAINATSKQYEDSEHSESHESKHKPEIINLHDDGTKSDEGHTTPMEKAMRLSSSFLHSARSRIDSDPAIVVDASNHHVKSPSFDAASSPETAKGRRLTSFLNSARSKLDLDPAGATNDNLLATPTPSEDMSDRDLPGTPPSQKLKKSMKTMGNKFKSMF